MSTATAVLAAFLVLVGTSHGLIPGYYEALVPPWLPAPRRLVFLTGAMEIVLGLGMVVSATRAPAAVATVALFVVYLATHVEAMARVAQPGRSLLDRAPVVVARIVVNAGYVVWASIVARSALS